MQNTIVEAQLREQLSRGKLSDLRKSGAIPGILYGGAKTDKGGQTLLAVNEKSFVKMLEKEGSNVLLELKMGSDNMNVVIKEIQRNYVTRKLIHVDFQRVDMTKKLEVSVPLHLMGEAPGVKLNGGILEHMTREVRVSCLPTDIPHQIDVDISKLDIGSGLTVADLPALSGVQILTDPHQLVANVVAPTILEEAPTAEAAATAEPEVIAKGKKPEEGEEGAAAPAAGAKGGTAPAKGAAPAAAKGTPAK